MNVKCYAKKNIKTSITIFTIMPISCKGYLSMFVSLWMFINLDFVNYMWVSNKLRDYYFCMVYKYMFEENMFIY